MNRKRIEFVPVKISHEKSLIEVKSRAVYSHISSDFKNAYLNVSSYAKVLSMAKRYLNGTVLNVFETSNDLLARDLNIVG